MRTSGTVIMWPSSTGSCTSPRARISASAWRTSSPARNARCDGPAFCSNRLAMACTGVAPNVFGFGDPLTAPEPVYRNAVQQDYREEHEQRAPLSPPNDATLLQRRRHDNVG